MIDTDKYEWDSKCRMVVIDGELYQRGSNGDYHLSLYDKSVAQLIADAPLLLAEVKRLRGQLGQAREYLWWCYDKERFGWEVDEEHWELIGRFLGASSDHNNNEWSEEE